jgi:hypothetical protein
MSSWRELTDDQLLELTQENDRRVREFMAQGVAFTDLTQHYMMVMLEEVLGPRGMAAAREKHHLWLKDQLDQAAPEIRRARAAAMLGVPPAPPGANGHAHG